MSEVLIVPRQTIHKIITHCFHEMPYEGCGMLVDYSGVVEARPCRNDEPSTTSFQICVHDQKRIMEEGLPILGTYHSHPVGLASLSTGDVDMLPVDMVHMVVGMRESFTIRAWRLRATGRHMDEQVSKAIRRVHLQIT